MRGAKRVMRYTARASSDVIPFPRSKPSKDGGQVLLEECATWAGIINLFK